MFAFSCTLLHMIYTYTPSVLLAAFLSSDCSVAHARLKFLFEYANFLKIIMFPKNSGL